ncbi:MAG: class I SAM-dependent methyltransferase [Zetaproteobacteria bacterium]|nr:MAG: class I SAM-dependent methyltransferase [Zetaproteobacteria bacterium]
MSGQSGAAERSNRDEDEAAYWTPRRARLFNLALQSSDFPLQTIKALGSALAGCGTVLDVGAGVGALTVLFAKQDYRVTAIEPNPVMLQELQANLARNRLDNVRCFQAAWRAGIVEPHDLIVVANVAPIFADLLPFLAEAEPLARRAMALVRNVGPGSEKFYFGELYPQLLGRAYPGREDYLRTVTLLHSIGIYAHIQIIDYHFDQPFEDFFEAVQFWKDAMGLESADQERRLVAFLEGRLERVGERWIAPMRRRSAVIWWRTAPPDPA